MFCVAILLPVSYFIFLHRYSYFSLNIVFDAVSSDTDKIFSINDSAYVLVFPNCIDNHSEWLINSVGTN